MLGKESKHAYDTTPKKEMKLKERAEVRKEASEAVLQRKAETKCSKPQGQYCRIHNPAPRFANATPESVFDSVFPKHPNLAQTVIPPVLGTKMEDIDKEWRQAKKNLYSYAEENNIHPATIMEHVYGWYGLNPDEELASLNKKYQETQNMYDEEIKNREIVLTRYLNKLVESEFSDPIDQKIAKTAVLCRFTVGEDEEDGDYEFSETGNVQIEKIGVSRETFYQTINEEHFAKKLTNIEKAYIVNGRVKTDNVEKLAHQLTQTRKKFSQLEQVSKEDMHAGAEVYFKATNFLPSSESK